MKFLQLHTVLVAWPVQKDWFVIQLLCKSDFIVLGRSRTVRLVLMTFAFFFCLLNRSVWVPHNCGKCGDCCCGSGLYRIFTSIIFLFWLILRRTWTASLRSRCHYCTYLYDAAKLMQYQRTEIPQRLIFSPHNFVYSYRSLISLSSGIG